MPALPLFVYGTLMRGQAAPIRLPTRAVVPASVRGRLYALPEGYPALSLSAPGGGFRVHGELCFLRDPSAVLPVVDDYEDYDPDRPTRGLYIRRICTVVRDDSDAAVAAWCYEVVASRIPPLLRAGARELRPPAGCNGIRWSS